jgi:cell wall assembly regulator SMI1
MQKVTRPLTQEIELGGERLALTLSAEGVSVRLVGSRKPAHEISWANLISALTHTSGQASSPTPDELAAALDSLRKGAAPKPSPPAGRTVESPFPGPESSSVPDMARLLARLEKWLAEHRPHFHRGLLPGATPAELENLRQSLGVPLPESLKAWLAWHNGISPDTMARFEENWILMSSGQIAEAKRELDADAAETGWQPVWIPFLDDDAGDYVCLDTSQPGVPVREFWLDRKEHPVVAPSLEACLAERIEAMERGEFSEDPERGTFLRRLER